MPACAADVHLHVFKAAKAAAGSLDFPSIQMALDRAPEAGLGNRVYIHIAPGVYAERVNVSVNHPRTTLLGMGSRPSDVVITASQSPASAGGIFFTETMRVDAEDFQADNLTVENAAGPVGPAIALAVTGDRAIFKHCRILGMQETLLADGGRQYYTGSYIAGANDLIAGNAAAVFDNSELHMLSAGGVLTAQSRTLPTQTTGFVIANSRITADAAPPGEPGPDGKPSPGVALGHPWRAYARVVLLNTELPAALVPAAWVRWSSAEPKDSRVDATFAEFHSSGAGAAEAMLKRRAVFSQQISGEEAKQFLPANFLAGDDLWNPEVEAAKLP